MKSAALLDKLMAGARSSSWGVTKFNSVMQRVIPFNRPHRIRLVSVTDLVLKTTMPYRRSNLNHLKGIHACAIATLAEYTSGLYLLQKASSAGYRLIMKSINVEYHYQAKSAVFASFGLSDEAYERRVSAPLKRDGLVLEEFVVEVYDDQQHHIATAKIVWQLKDWEKTRTAVA